MAPVAVPRVMPAVATLLNVSVNVVTVVGIVTVCTSFPAPMVVVAWAIVPVPPVTADVNWGTFALASFPVKVAV